MYPIHDLTLLLNAIFFGLSIFLAFMLWNQKTSYQFSNQILSILLIAFSITTFNTVIRLTHYIGPLDFYQNISNSVLLTIGPSIYLFIKIRTSDISISHVLRHYMLFFLYVTALIVFLLLSLEKQKEILDQIAFVTFIVQFMAYIIVSFALVNNYNKRTKENFSNLEKHNIGWIKTVLFILLATLILRITLLGYKALYESVLDIVGLNLTLIFGIATCYLGYKIFKNPQLFIRLPSYATSNLSAHDLRVNKQKIETAMNDQSLYLSSGLTISELADQSKLPSRLVSQTLNQEMKQNFFDYVNGFRVQYLIERLKEPESVNYKLQALMQDAGFQSPSVAYAAFKKITGTTPAQYRKTI